MSQERFGPLIFALTKAWRTTLDHRLAPLGLSEARWQCLLKLGRAGGPLPQVELADRMGITPPTLVKLLDRLEDDGLVLRQPEPGDRRAKRVQLTEKASALAQLVEREALRLREEVFAAISEEELEAAEKVINKLLARLEEVNHEVPLTEVTPA